MFHILLFIKREQVCVKVFNRSFSKLMMFYFVKLLLIKFIFWSPNPLWICLSILGENVFWWRVTLDSMVQMRHISLRWSYD